MGTLPALRTGFPVHRAPRLPAGETFVTRRPASRWSKLAAARWLHGIGSPATNIKKARRGRAIWIGGITRRHL